MSYDFYYLLNGRLTSPYNLKKLESLIYNSVYTSYNYINRQYIYYQDVKLYLNEMHLTNIDPYLNKYKLSLDFKKYTNLLKQLNQMINNSQIQVFTESIKVESETYKPTIKMDHWQVFMTNEKIVVGYYEGELNDMDNISYNYSSYIQIHPLMRGTGLCSILAFNAYKYVIYDLKAEFMLIFITAENKAGACRCYVDAALNNNLKVYIQYKNIYKQIFLKSECNDYIEDNLPVKMIFAHHNHSEELFKKMIMI